MSPSLLQQGIRGQIAQGFTAVLTAGNPVAPLLRVSEAAGTATARVENGGDSICFDASINAPFNPTIGTLNFGPVGTDGNVVADFSSTKQAPGRFFGCLTLVEMGISLSAVCEFLADPNVYYIIFHEDGPPDSPAFMNTIRGQLA